MWKNIRDMQRGRRGLVPMRSATIGDDKENLCTTPDEQQQQWRRHFTRVLNIPSPFDESEIGQTKQHPLRPQLAVVPSKEELEGAIRMMRNGKAGGNSGILPEMHIMLKVACSDDDLLNLLLDLVHTQYGRREGSHRSGPMLWLCLLQRRVTSQNVTTGKALHCWT